jgi:uncharacterized protein (UPF0254 family)
MAVVVALRHRENLYREQTREQIAKIISESRALDDADESILRALARGRGAIPLQKWLDNARASRDLRNRFIALEEDIKRRYDGALPTWLKDDRNWRYLDKRYGGG